MKFCEQNKLKAVTFSYDDGVVQDIRLIELLNKYNLKATFNLNSEKLGNMGTYLRNGQRLCSYKVSRKDAATIYSGHEIAGHTLTHPTLVNVADDKEIIRQVEQDRLNLSEIAGYEVLGFAYPGGGINNDDRVAEIIKNNTGVKYARTTTNTDSFDRQENLFRFNPNVYHTMQFDRLMEMGKQFIEMKADKPQIFYIWGHSYELDFLPDHWTRLEEFFKLISNKDDIFYGTNKEVIL